MSATTGSDTILAGSSREGTSPSRWLHWLVVPPLIALLAVGWPTLRTLFDLWWASSFDYGHGLVVAPIAVFLMWLRRHAFRDARVKPSLLGALLVAGLVAAWVGARVLGVLIVEQVVLVLLIPSIVLAVLGWNAARVATLPALYLFCAIPIWSYFSPLLQSSTANMSAELARAAGVPVYLEGLYINIPTGRFLVAEVCSGIRYLLAALALGAFYALVHLDSPWRRIALVVAAVALGVAFNWIRVGTIVTIGHYSEMQSSLIKSHLGFGWGLFVLVVVLLIALGRVLEIGDRPPAAPSDSHRRDRGGNWAGAAGTMLASLVMIAAVPLLAAAATAAPALARVELAALGAAQGWRELQPAPADGWVPQFVGPDLQHRASFMAGQHRVDLFVAWYRAQQQGAEVVNGRNALFQTERWRRIAVRPVAERVAGGRGLTVTELQLQSRQRPHERRLVWSAYRIAGRWTTHPVEAKWLQLRGLLSRRTDASAVAFSTRGGVSVEANRDTLRNFMQAVLPALERRLDAASGR